MKFRKLIFLSTVVFILLACSMADISFQTQPEITVVEVLEVSETPSPALSPSIEPSPTLTPTPTPLDPTCVSPEDHEGLGETFFEDYPNLILSYLNDGAAANELATSLFQQGILFPDSKVTIEELTGDLKEDLIVSITDKTSLTLPPAGALLIFTCQGDQFALTHIEQSGEFFGAPILVHIQDMNQDGIKEVIYSSSKCGAHTCFEDTQILSWTGFSFERKLDGSTSELPSPNVQITDYDQDGVYDFEVVSGGYGSVGAGPQRSKSTIWRYDPEAGIWAFGEENDGISNYRVHLVHDADAAMRRGEYQVALLLYDQVINNPNLLDWQDPDLEQLNLGAYVRYKIVVSFALQGDVGSARAFLDSVKNIYASFSEQSAFMEMAELFLNAYESEGEQKACEAAIVYSAEHADVILAPLGQGVYGYANPDYTPFDICP